MHLHFDLGVFIAGLNHAMLLHPKWPNPQPRSYALDSLCAFKAGMLI